MNNVNKMFFKVNAYDIAIADPSRKPQRGEIGVLMYDNKVLVSRIISHMDGVKILGRLAQIQRDYSHGTPPLTVFDTRDERAFYNCLQPFEQLLYRGVLKAEQLRTFGEYDKAESFFVSAALSCKVRRMRFFFVSFTVICIGVFAAE